jgi:hypothetical protein
MVLESVARTKKCTSRGDAGGNEAAAAAADAEAPSAPEAEAEADEDDSAASAPAWAISGCFDDGGRA